jgi:hypothetical protein
MLRQLDSLLQCSGKGIRGYRDHILAGRFASGIFGMISYGY